MVLVVVLAAVAALILRPKNIAPSKPAPPKTVAVINAAPPPAKSPVAPPASDTNWSLTLDQFTLPDAPVTGRIHGQDFLLERAAFQNGSLILRQGTRGPVEFGVLINFSGALPEALAGKKLNVLADTNKSARITWSWKTAAGSVEKQIYTNRYAMRLDFGAINKGRLPGKIYLCTPDDEKSYLAGDFNAFIIKPKPKPPVTPAPPKN